MHPLQFMLASPEEDADAIMRRVGSREAWVEDKYDGIRGQLVLKHHSAEAERRLARTG